MLPVTAGQVIEHVHGISLTSGVCVALTEAAFAAGWAALVVVADDIVSDSDPDRDRRSPAAHSGCARRRLFVHVVLLFDPGHHIPPATKGIGPLRDRSWSD